MGKTKRTPKLRRRRKAGYGAEVTTALVKAWEIFDYPWARRMARQCG